MSNNIWPKIRKVMKHGKPMFMADARIAGKGERRFFSTNREAETWAQLQRVKRQNEGGRAFQNGELADFGWNVQDAIRFALDHLRRLRGSVPLEQAITQFIETKQTTGRSERYCNDLRMRLGRLQRAFPDTTIARISTQELEDFLSGMKVGAETRNTHRRDMRTLWNFAEKRGWALGMTATNTERAAASEKKVVSISAA